MTRGESEDYESQCFLDWVLEATNVSFEFGLDSCAMETLQNLANLESACEGDFISISHLRDKSEAVSYNGVDGVYSMDKIAGDFGTAFQAPWPGHSMKGLDEDHCTSPLPSPPCGLCVLENLQVSPREYASPRRPYPQRRSLNRSTRDKYQKIRERQSDWSSCRSTRTFMSRTSESLKGAGRWLLDHEQYCQWLNQSSSFIWLCGRSGVGKSVLMSTVIHDLAKNRRPGELMAYYFANGSYSGVSTAKAIFCSILGQLLFREPIRESFTEVLPVLNELITARNLLTLTSVASLFLKIRHLLRSHEILYLLLDGLDEVAQSSPDQELVLEIIHHASQHDPVHQVKCFVSSRSTFFGDRLPKGALQVDLDSHRFLNRTDMSIYVQESLQRLVFPYHSQDSMELEQSLLDIASGSFLILRLILQRAGQGSGDRRTSLKNFLMDLNVASEVSVGTLYGGMLAQIEECHKEAVLYVLRWVTFAARPLDFHELLALHQETGIGFKKEDINTISAGLLVRNGNQIQFFHISVREYLESHLTDKWEELSEEANEMIAHACLKLLSAEDILRSLNLTTMSFSSSKSTKASQSVHSVPYAQSYWVYHYKRAEKRSSYLAGLLHDILEQGLIGKNNAQKLEVEERPKQNICDIWKLVTAPQQLQVENRQNDVQTLFPTILNLALRISAQYGFLKLAKLELDMGADVNAFFDPDEQTPLCLAAREGHLDIVQLLLQRGANPHFASGSGWAPLAYAMANSHSEIQEMLTASLQGSWRSNNPLDWPGTPDIQDFCLTPVLSPPIFPSSSSAGSFRVDYELRAMSDICDDAGNVLPAIMVSGQVISESEVQLLIGPTSARRASVVVRWYAGIEMYLVLRHVSKRGIDEVRKLLIAAGNPAENLDMAFSLSKLLATSTL